MYSLQHMRKFAFLAFVGIVAVAIVAWRSSSDVSSNESLVIKGSDTEVQLVSNIAEAFANGHDEADIAVTGGGSGTGIAALLNKEIDIANSSRPLKQEEWDTAKAAGLDVQEFILARDGLSVITHPSNAIKFLTMEQIGKMYSGIITNWKDVGGPDASIVLYGRQSTSGTYVFFRDTVVRADYAASMRTMEGSQAIVDAVKADINGVGYVGVGYVKDLEGKPRSDLNILSVADKSGSTPVSPLDEPAVLSGQYPIFRPIYQYLARIPAKDSIIDQFLRFELSDEGIAIIKQAGFYSLTASDVSANQAFLGKIR